MSEIKIRFSRIRAHIDEEIEVLHTLSQVVLKDWSFTGAQGVTTEQLVLSIPVSM